MTQELKTDQQSQNKTPNWFALTIITVIGGGFLALLAATIKDTPYEVKKQNTDKERDAIKQRISADLSKSPDKTNYEITGTLLGVQKGSYDDFDKTYAPGIFYTITLDKGAIYSSTTSSNPDCQHGEEHQYTITPKDGVIPILIRSENSVVPKGLTIGNRYSLSVKSELNDKLIGFLQTGTRNCRLSIENKNTEGFYEVSVVPVATSIRPIDVKAKVAQFSRPIEP